MIVRAGVQHDEIKPDHATSAGCSGGHPGPNLISFIGALGRYESPESASRACRRWADSAGLFSVRRAGLWTSTSQNLVLFCKQEAHQFVGCEVAKEGAAEVSDNPEDPKGFLAGEVPEAMDSGKRWR